MSEVLLITCNACGARVSKAERTRIRWASQPARRDAWDACLSCSDKALAALTGEAPAPPPVARRVPVTVAVRTASHAGVVWPSDDPPVNGYLAPDPA